MIAHPIWLYPGSFKPADGGGDAAGARYRPPRKRSGAGRKSLARTEDHLRQDQELSGAAVAEGDRHPRRRDNRDGAGDQPPEPGSELDLEEAYHDDLSGKRRRHRRANTAAKQREPNSVGRCQGSKAEQAGYASRRVLPPCLSSFVKNRCGPDKDRDVPQKCEHQESSLKLRPEVCRDRMTD